MNAETLRQARNRGADEALLFNPAGALIGACMANVFLKKDDQWLTPSLACGARDGAVRSWVLNQLGVRETIVTRADALSSESIFLTSSWLGLMPLHQVEDTTLAPVAPQLQQCISDWNRQPH